MNSIEIWKNAVLSSDWHQGKPIKMFPLTTPTSNFAKSKSQKLFSDLILLQHIDLFVKVYKWVRDQGYWNELHVSLQTGLYSAVSRAVIEINLLVLIESYIVCFRERKLKIG